MFARQTENEENVSRCRKGDLTVPPIAYNVTSKFEFRSSVYVELGFGFLGLATVILPLPPRSR